MQGHIRGQHELLGQMSCAGSLSSQHQLRPSPGWWGLSDRVPGGVIVGSKAFLSLSSRFCLSGLLADIEMMV